MKDAIAIPVRCAVTGGRFLALFAWNDSSSRYELFDVVPGEPASPEPDAALESAAWQTFPSGPARPVTLPRVNRSSTAADGANGPTAGPPSVPPCEVNGSHLDWSGFFCPHCGYGKTRPIKKAPAVKCGTCGDLVCGARVTPGSIRDAFRCHDDCGGQALLDWDTVPSFQAHALREERPTPQPVTRPASLPRPVPKAIPAPQPKELAGPRTNALPAPRRLGLPAPERG